jgi:antitoxin PrlF
MATTQVPCSESTLTDRYQTTVPAAVRKYLGLNKNDKICYTLYPDGAVLISRAKPVVNDPVLEKFLDFLTQDMQENPQSLLPINSGLVSKIQSLVSEVDFDLNELLADEDE